MHSTKWGHRAPHEAGPRTGLRAQLSRGAHLTWTSLRVLALNPRLMNLPFFALVFTGFTWLFVVLSFLALGLPPASPSSGFLYQEMFLAYLITYFLSCYFMAAIVGASFVRLQGGHPTVMDGVEAANASFFQILVWSTCAATLGWAVGAILYWLVLSALWSVVHGILVVTLYHYATDSEAAFGFNWQALNHPWIR